MERPYPYGCGDGNRRDIDGRRQHCGRSRRQSKQKGAKGEERGGLEEREELTKKARESNSPSGQQAQAEQEPNPSQSASKRCQSAQPQGAEKGREKEKAVDAGEEENWRKSRVERLARERDERRDS
jgi:hypothetical protein